MLQSWEFDRPSCILLQCLRFSLFESMQERHGHARNAAIDRSEIGYSLHHCHCLGPVLRTVGDTCDPCSRNIGNTRSPVAVNCIYLSQSLSETEREGERGYEMKVEKARSKKALNVTQDG